MENDFNPVPNPPKRFRTLEDKLVEDGMRKVLEHPRVDPFWGAIQRAIEQGLR
ncbi:MAG: hypothetical protein ACREJQ_00040 [bacterium]